MDINAKRLCLSSLLEPVAPVHNCSSSSSSSDEEDERIFHIRVKDYVELVATRYSLRDFKQHFRMERATIQVLIQQYGQHAATWHGGWSYTSPEKAVLLTVLYLSNLETFRQIADRFDVTLSCAHSIVKNVTKFITDISKEHILWPNAAIAHEQSNIFGQKKGISNVLGAIDGSHFRINRPLIHQEDYCNRKGYHSVILQGVVNANMEFIDVHIGEPGSMHDARVFRRSSLYKKSIDNPEQLFYNTYRLLGDSAYPSLDWLLTPIKDNGQLTEVDKDFNFRHSSTRMVVENAFGHLKGRFRRLQKFDNLSIPFITKCVLTACVLHNICQRTKDDNDDIYLDGTFQV